MSLINLRSAAFAATLSAAAAFVGPAIAAESTSVEQCEAMAMRFKTADVSHMSPDKLESARRQAAHGERLCKSHPETGVKALDIAFKDIGITRY